MLTIIPLNNNCEEYARYIYERLHNMNIYCVFDTNYRSSLVSRYSNYNCSIISVGYTEVNDNKITVRNLNNQIITIDLNSFFQNVSAHM